ncbi:cytochrome c oxidase assembly factor CtaG [Paenibacillus sp. GSMTC-2017]|uniref:cytochrome c oxidase assembly factor CtaG n=1 Tax=Paenibacillus sp. GSMTC-2017 TaxID=2794350 RepID=UPI0018DA1F30|nr:cytochrome c oxidase assembly factor CtaG [Paenibacillus sp. GSMTC-2017]MBH5320188.1 cytochrome c oxidase assembly factor CtaG [Paenibacillus sp. GSMTC-2017]
MLDLNKYFSFAELWTPMFLFAMIAVIIAYFYLIGPWREKHFPSEAKATAKQKWLFVGGVTLVYLSHGGPLNLLGHLMFTYHMVNMSISYLVVPPMILLGLPAFVWRKVFSANFWRKFRFLMNPIVTLILFNMLFSFYHIPDVHDYVMTNFTIHRLYYVVLFITSFMMWWQIACPVPEWSKLADFKKMAYVFANGVLLTPACGLIIFADVGMYATYSDPQVWATAMGYCMPGDTSYLVSEFGGPQFFNSMSVVGDQQLGGIIMKLVQELMYGIILVYIFKQWFKREHADDVPNPETA